MYLLVIYWILVLGFQGFSLCIQTLKNKNKQKVRGFYKKKLWFSKFNENRFFFFFHPFRRLLNTNRSMKYIVGCTVRNCRDGDWWLFNVETDTRSTFETLCCIQVQIQDLPLKLCAVSRYRYKIYHWNFVLYLGTATRSTIETLCCIQV